MSIIKNKIKDNFSQIPNELIEDRTISVGAFKVMCYLFSRPSGWKVFNKQIMQAINIKKTDTLSKYWKELVASGWVHRTKVTDLKDGIIGSFIYTLNLSPKIVCTPKDGVHQNRDYPKMGEHSNTNLLSNTKKSNSDFEKIWDIYSHKKSREQSLKAFKAQMKRYSYADITLAVNRYMQERETLKQKKLFVPVQKHLSTFLNNLSDYLDYYEEIKAPPSYLDSFKEVSA